MTDALPPDLNTSAALARHELRQAVLDRLVRFGLKLVDEMEHDLDAAKAERDAAPDPSAPRRPVATPELCLGFSRAARALRMTVMLQKRLDDEQASPGSGAFAKSIAAPDPLAAVRDSRKISVVRLIADTGHRVHNDGDAIERLIQEAAERLEDEDLQDDVMSLPLADLVRRVARDLGLSPDWPGLDSYLWTHHDLPPAGAAPKPDDGPPRRQTCLDRPDPVLATKKGPGPPPAIIFRTIMEWPERPVPDG
jgi:hypothetical protein